jgi:hypothetical protein
MKISTFTATVVAVLAAGELRAGESMQKEWGSIPPPIVVPRSPESDTSIPFGPPDSLAPTPGERLPVPPVLPFGVGEWLKFSIDYGIINAGKAIMEVRDLRRISGNDCFDIRTEARSNAFFSKFYKVWDRAQTFLDVDSVLPWRFEKHQREGSYRKDLVIKFDRHEHFARYENGDEVMMHPHTQDELSAFYYLRTLPLEVGRDVLIDNHTNRKNYPLKIIVHARETIEVGAGQFDCFVIEPVIREGGIFQAKGTLTIWITADHRRIPVKMRTKIAVGAVTASLKEYRLGKPWERYASAELPSSDSE